MDPQVRRQWHFTRLDLFADLFEFLDLAISSIGAELTHIQVPPAIVNVVLKEPAERLDIRVPGIDGIVRVAVVTRPFENRINIWRHRNGNCQSVGLNRRGNRLIDGKKLYHNKCGNDHNGQHLEHCLQFLHIRPQTEYIQNVIRQRALRKSQMMSQPITEYLMLL